MATIATIRAEDGGPTLGQDDEDEAEDHEGGLIPQTWPNRAGEILPGQKTAR